MASLDSYFNDEPLHLKNKTPPIILDEALTHLASAIAALYRAGPGYANQTAPLWHFAAGTLSQHEYQKRIELAAKMLPKKISVVQDVEIAGDRLREAIMVWREFGDGRDADDLEEAVTQILLGVEGEW